MNPFFSLASLNSERGRYRDRIRTFLQREKPDVVCLQEVFEEDMKDFAQHLSMEYAFACMVLLGRRQLTSPPFLPFGVGILSHLPVGDVRKQYYYGKEATACQRAFDGRVESYWRPLLSAKVQKHGQQITFATTHFTWTPDGKPSEAQRKDLQKLLLCLEDFDEILLCGDFNAPRGGEIFGELARRYKDNIPQEYRTSIDTKLHRAGEELRGRPLMVDGLFTSPCYKVSNVRLQDGVSDHLAIIARVNYSPKEKIGYVYGS